ncbi:MAG: DUF4956 domain-containing protein [Chitinophagales bacterium]
MDLLAQIELLDMELINSVKLTSLIARYIINLIVTFVIVKVIYYSINRDRDYLFTYFVFNTLVFFVCYLMSSVNLGVGFGFGLFALFSILRYRTSTLAVKEMTYLFAVITIAVINAVVTDQISIAELLFTNLTIGIVIYYFDIYWKDGVKVQSIIYEKIENIHPTKREALISDLKERTGLNIMKVELSNINFMNDTVKAKIFYMPDQHNIMGRDIETY